MPVKAGLLMPILINCWKNWQGVSDRHARFRTVISLLINGQETLFEGICEGRIIEERRGNNGFGYDPVFIPDGSAPEFCGNGHGGKESIQSPEESHRKTGSIFE